MKCYRTERFLFIKPLEQIKLSLILNSENGRCVISHLGFFFNLNKWNENHFPSGDSKLFFATYETTATTAITGATSTATAATAQQQQQLHNSNCTTATATQYDSECSKGYQRWQRVPFYYYFSFSFSFFSAFCPTVRVVEIDQRSIQPTIKPSNHLTDLQAGWENSENIAKNCSACFQFFFLPISIFFSRVLKLHKWLNMGKLSSHRRITS